MSRPDALVQCPPSPPSSMPLHPLRPASHDPGAWRLGRPAVAAAVAIARAGRFTTHPPPSHPWVSPHDAGRAAHHPLCAAPLGGGRDRQRTADARPVLFFVAGGLTVRSCRRRGGVVRRRLGGRGRAARAAVVWRGSGGGGRRAAGVAGATMEGGAAGGGGHARGVVAPGVPPVADEGEGPQGM